LSVEFQLGQSFSTASVLELEPDANTPFRWIGVDILSEDPVGRKVGDLAAEERVELRNISEDEYDFGHESTDLSVVFAVR
jgi:hypothetical protein